MLQMLALHARIQGICMQLPRRLKSIAVPTLLGLSPSLWLLGEVEWLMLGVNEPWRPDTSAAGMSLEPTRDSAGPRTACPHKAAN